MRPSKERSCGQRTFLSLLLIGVVVFGVHFESDCICQLLEALGAWSLFSFASR